VIDERNAILELKDCMRRAADITRQLGYARLDTRWISVNSILNNLNEKLDALVVAKSAASVAIAKRTGDASSA